MKESKRKRLPLEEVRVRVGLPRDPRAAGIRYTDEIDGKPVPIAVDAATERPAAVPARSG